MKSIHKIKHFLALASIALCGSIVRAADIFSTPVLRLSNTDETIATDQLIGVHEDSLSGLYVDSGIANGEKYRHLLYKWGSDNQHVAVAGALDTPLGTIDNMNVATTDRVTVLLWGRGKTRKCVAASAITIGDKLYMAASGQVANTGSIYIGIALNTVAAQYGIVEVLPASTGSSKAAIFSGVRTWAGGAATTDAVTLTGLLTTDTVVATLTARNSTETLVLATPTADTLTFTLSANGTNGTTKIAYAVYR